MGVQLSARLGCSAPESAGRLAIVRAGRRNCAGIWRNAKYRFGPLTRLALKDPEVANQGNGKALLIFIIDARTACKTSIRGRPLCAAYVRHIA